VCERTVPTTVASYKPINIVNTSTVVYIKEVMSYCFRVRCSKYLAALGLGWHQFWLSGSNCHLVVR